MFEVGQHYIGIFPKKLPGETKGIFFTYNLNNDIFFMNHEFRSVNIDILPYSSTWTQLVFFGDSLFYKVPSIYLAEDLSLFFLYVVDFRGFKWSRIFSKIRVVFLNAEVQRTLRFAEESVRIYVAESTTKCNGLNSRTMDLTDFMNLRGLRILNDLRGVIVFLFLLLTV